MNRAQISPDCQGHCFDMIQQTSLTGERWCVSHLAWLERQLKASITDHQYILVFSVWSSFSLSYFAYGDIHPPADHITQQYQSLQPRLLQTYSVWLQQQADWITEGADWHTYSKHRATGELPAGDECIERTPAIQCTQTPTGSAWLIALKNLLKDTVHLKTTKTYQKPSRKVWFSVSNVKHSL